MARSRVTAAGGVVVVVTAAGGVVVVAGMVAAAAATVFFFTFLKNICRVLLTHTAKSLPCDRQKAHDKETLCRYLVAVWSLPCTTHGKGFAVCKPGFAVWPCVP
jgi:hypothetical protein